MSERVSKVFGAMGSRDESRKEAQLKGIVVAGIKVPSRPEEPTNCCMSGCVNCVWELYKDEIEEWREVRNKARRVLMEPKYRHVRWPQLLGPEPKGRTSNPETATASVDPEKEKQEEKQMNEFDEENYGLNTGISVFIQTEKKIRARKQARQQARQQGNNQSRSLDYS